MGSELPDYHKVARRFTTLSYTAFVRFSFNIKTFNSDKPNHCLKEDSTMFFLLVFLVLCTAVTSGQNCPKEKRVGDTCYTRVAMAHTHQHGCMENCSYKKTNSSDTGLYCFKTGSLQVTECGNFTGGRGTCFATPQPLGPLNPCSLSINNCNFGFAPFFPNFSNENGTCP